MRVPLGVNGERRPTFREDGPAAPVDSDSVFESSEPGPKEAAEQGREPLFAWLSDRRRIASVWPLLVVLCVYFVSGLVWLLKYRAGQPFDIDEAGYLTIALHDMHALHDGGLSAWLSAVEEPTGQAPAMTALASLVLCVFGPHPLVALCVPMLIGAVPLVVVWAMARRIAGRSAAVVATVMAMATPGFLNYSRDFHFACAATATTALALYALWRSAGAASLRWSVALGLCIGLMPLSRTMTVAFVPALAGAALICAMAEPGRRRRIRNLLVAGLVSAGVASSWLAVNGNAHVVWVYLRGYGYGRAAAAYGSSSSWFSSARLEATAQSVLDYVYLPLGAVLLVAAVMTVARAANRIWVSGIVVAIRSPLFPAAVLVAGGVLAMTSSENQGSAFVAPLVPPGCLLAAVVGLRTGRRVATAVLGSCAVLITLTAASPLLLPGLTRGGAVTTLPGHLWARDWSGAGIMEQNVLSALEPNSGDNRKALQYGRAWVAFNRSLAVSFSRQPGVPVALGFQDALLNTSSLALQEALMAQPGPYFVGVPRAVIDDTRAAYLTWMRGPAMAPVGTLLIVDGASRGYVPVVTADAMKAAAAEAGFAFADTRRMPDGRVLEMWDRPAVAPH